MTASEQESYNWSSEYETWRQKGRDAKDREDARSDFERDRDRIVHSIAFRRLQGKTQIFASTLAGAMRTRLTHTLEVAQIGEALGRRFGLPEHLGSAVCLAHDLGHPPFGHFGEKVLADLMLPYGGFDANAQTLRIVARLELKNTRYAGLNLCRATQLGLLKYPYYRVAPTGAEHAEGTDLRQLETGEWVSRRRFIYDDDHDLVAGLLNGTGLKLLSPGSRAAPPPPRTLACQIADWADDIAYSLHDLEDGIMARFLDPDHFSDPTFVRAVTESVNANREEGATEVDEGHVASVLRGLKSRLNDVDAVNKLGGLRQVTRGYINDFLLSTEVNRTDPDARAFGFELVPDDGHRGNAEIFKAMASEFLLKDPRTTRYMFKGRRMLEQLFEALTENPKIVDATDDQLLGRPERELLREAPADNTLRARIVVDYLANQTEGHLVALYRTMFESAGALMPPGV